MQYGVMISGNAIDMVTILTQEYILIIKTYGMHPNNTSLMRLLHG